MPLNPECMFKLREHLVEMNVRKPPLSMHTVGGGIFVIRARDMKPVRISELAHTHSANHFHKLLTPSGEREVCIQIGSFQTAALIQRFRSETDEAYSFPTTLDCVRLDALTGYALDEQMPAVFNAMRVTDGQQTYEHLKFEKTFRQSQEHYIYSLTPGPIYLGAGKRPLFLPFEVI